ncbi:hypothetical protein R3P38DRAFT_3288138 [Favolaschia claudopus]|uniref:Uncharacterized protein n=1 Tax=Favolaschia claudopus TaxID=2862362 RepID=A0AAV9ZYI4_9AGAR
MVWLEIFCSSACTSLVSEPTLRLRVHSAIGILSARVSSPQLLDVFSRYEYRHQQAASMVFAFVITPPFSHIDVAIHIYTLVPSRSSFNEIYAATAPHSAPLCNVPVKAARDDSSHPSSATVDTTPLPALQVLRRGVTPKASSRHVSKVGGQGDSG